MILSSAKLALAQGAKLERPDSTLGERKRRQAPGLGMGEKETSPSQKPDASLLKKHRARNNRGKKRSATSFSERQENIVLSKKI